MGYLGEHLLPGQLGHFFIVLSLMASLVATFSYFKSAQSRNETDAAYWKKLARYAFITEVIAVISIFALLFYIIHNHLFEYYYAWHHSSRSLEFKYMLACFWEGQEGSFLLWSIWHCVLGLILIKTSKQWEAPIMTVVSFAQFCIATMITGIYIFGWKMGSNPFILLRDSGVLDVESVSHLHINFDLNQALKSDYMKSIIDGNDLNPLLQNYWMVIHPPVLFMGFASTIVPFAFVIAGLWKKKIGEWIRPALPWALFSAAVLGVGIMMGARWAYESLTFGGYWAWDPVENASLVPWLVMISGIHTMLIYKHSGHSLRAACISVIISFGLILYSTFLTRSGILGDASVHAFTDLGMNAQLYFLLFLFCWPFVIILEKTFKEKTFRIIEVVVLLSLIAITGYYNYSIHSKFIAAFLPCAYIFIVVLRLSHFIIEKIQIRLLIAACVTLVFLFPLIDNFFNLPIDLPTLILNKPLSPILAFVAVLEGVLLLINQVRKQVPPVEKEENGSSREFWMFIGSFVLLLSALIIITKTSFPVFNKIFEKKIAPPEDPEFGYNSIQIYVAIILGLLTAIGQYLKYKETSARYFLKKIWIPTVISVIAASLMLAFGNINYVKKGPLFLGSIWLGVVCAMYAIIANAAYIWLGIKGKLKLSGGSISHVGFSMVLLGILITSSNKEILSKNNNGIQTPLGPNENPRENQTLIKGISSNMGKYTLTYESDSANPNKPLWFYSIRFKSNDGKEDFVLQPNAFVNYKGNQSLLANPSAKHYWDHDIFTFITSLPNPDKQKDTASFKINKLKPGDTCFYSAGFMVLEKVKTQDSLPPKFFGVGDTMYQASLKIHSKTGSLVNMISRLAIVKNEKIAVPDTISSEGLVLQLQKVNADNSIELGVKESDAVLKFVTIKTYRYPFINLLWIGVIITALGIIISMVRRIQLNRNSISRS